jgi:hypothetical protein
VVLRNLYHSIHPNEIQAELETHGHKVRIVLNIRHRVTKEPLPLYFVDLEPHDNNKSIYDLQFLCNMKITVEAPRKKNHTAQFTRCQSYGHTNSYCSRPYLCVKCGCEHNTTLCTKTLLPQPHVLYAVEPIQQITMDVLYTKIYSKHGVKPITQYTHPLFRHLIHS